MEIIKLNDGDKRKYIDLLLIADEQESMIDKYLERGEMFVLNDNGVKAECVVTNEADGIYELKNIAVMPDSQRMGYGKRLIDYLFSNMLTVIRYLWELVIFLQRFASTTNAALRNHIV